MPNTALGPERESACLSSTSAWSHSFVRAREFDRWAGGMRPHMGEHELEPGGLRPYFAEIPYYVWGEVNYDSDGNCDRPRSRDWTWMDLKNRETKEGLSISIAESAWLIEGSEPAAARAAQFLCERSGARIRGGQPIATDENWTHHDSSARAAAVACEFEKAELDRFDSHLFWGSWKWIGWFATDFTWPGRWIMHSVVRGDVRAVNLCVEWLRAGTVSPNQSAAIRGALQILTGESFGSDDEWIRWYDGSGSTPGHRGQYPEPDFEAWWAELKSIGGGPGSGG